MQLESAVATAVRGRIGPLGWSQVDEDEPAYSSKGPDALVYNIGLNFSTRGGGLRMLPALGIQHVPTSRLVSQFKGLPPARTSTFGRALADVMVEGGYPEPPFGRWQMQTATEVTSVAERLTSDLQSYGFPFFTMFGTLDDVLSRLADRPRDPNTDATLAVATALSGRIARATELLSEMVLEAANQAPPLSARTMAFIRACTEHFGIDVGATG